MKVSKILGSLVLGFSMAPMAHAFDMGERVESQIDLQLEVTCAASIDVPNSPSVVEGLLAMTSDRGTLIDVGKVKFDAMPEFLVDSQCPYKVLIKTPAHLTEANGDQIAFSAAIVKTVTGTDQIVDSLSVVSVGDNTSELLQNGTPSEQPAVEEQSYKIKIQSGPISDLPAFVNNTDEAAPRAGIYTSVIEFAIEAL